MPWQELRICEEKLQVGDVVYRDYDGYAMSEGVFAQAEYNKDKLSAFLAGSISNTGYWRYDRFIMTSSMPNRKR